MQSLYDKITNANKDIDSIELILTKAVNAEVKKQGRKKKKFFFHFFIYFG